jgi:dihydrofolate reductase
MGLNTYKSLPKGALPNRRNCVLTRSVKELPGCECFVSCEEFAKSCKADEDVYIIGGASIYQQFIDKADRLCLTEIDDTPAAADTFFPDYSEGWHVVNREAHTKDERHDYEYAFVDYERTR